MTDYKRQSTRGGPVAKRGLFVNGIWHCDCQPTRLPAEKFQVKNGGKNHGRWFFTCQQPQPKRCTFYLWADDAKVREEAAVLHNSKSEPGVTAEQNVGLGGRRRTEQQSPQTPKTPGRQAKITDQVASYNKATESRRDDRSQTIEPDPFIETVHELPLEAYEWSSSDDENFLLDQARFSDSGKRRSLDESPSKARKTSLNDSPGRRQNTDAAEFQSRPTAKLVEDHFKTPSHPRVQPASGLLSPSETPHQVRRQLFQTSDAHETSEDKPVAPFSPSKPQSSNAALLTEAMSILQPIQTRIPTDVMTNLTRLLKRHELKTIGIEKGREVARSSLESKEQKVKDLEQRVDQLTHQLNTNREIIRYGHPALLKGTW